MKKTLALLIFILFLFGLSSAFSVPKDQDCKISYLKTLPKNTTARLYLLSGLKIDANVIDTKDDDRLVRLKIGDTFMSIKATSIAGIEYQGKKPEKKKKEKKPKKKSLLDPPEPIAKAERLKIGHHVTVVKGARLALYLHGGNIVVGYAHDINENDGVVTLHHGNGWFGKYKISAIDGVQWTP